MVFNGFSIYYQNTRGLRTKTHQFKRNLQLHSYDIISLTETWLLDGIHDSELFDNRYVVWRRDRNYAVTKEKYGGGVLLAIRNGISAVHHPEWSSSAEDIWVTITPNNKNKNSLKLHVCTIYLCNENLGNSYNVQVCNFTDRLSQIFNSHPTDLFLIMGDFNFSNIQWTSDISGAPPQYSGVAGHTQTYFFDTMLECNLTQYNIHRNINDRILDLVFCNSLLRTLVCEEPLVPEDTHHRSLSIWLNYEKVDHLNSKPRLKYYFESGDYDNIKLSFEKVDWNDGLLNNSLEQAVQNFYKNLYDVIDKYIPHKTIRNDDLPPWYNASLKKVLKEKFKYLRKYHIYSNIADYDSFSLLRHRAKVLEAECYTAYIKKYEDSIAKNPKLFWSFIKSQKLSTNNIPTSMSYDCKTANSGQDICQLFANYFQSTFLQSATPLDLRISNSSLYSGHTNDICNIEVAPENVRQLLKNLDHSKGAGPDRIPPVFAIKCSDSLTKPLTILFTRSLKEGIVPEIWKSAFITPVHKNGSKNDVKNYRPISKLCVFAKLLERLVFTQVQNCLQSSFILEQHGFLKNRSTTSNLISFTDYLTSHMDLRGQVDAIFTDYSKCFDRIDHAILLQKLLYAGIHGNLYRWFKSYIEKRSQAVVLKGYTSTWHTIPSGVPQGSLLGPMLFNIFVNDIALCFKHSKFLLYADDMKVFKQIRSTVDCHLLQQDLQRFEDYCKINKLDINVTKCHAITFTRKATVIKFKYYIKGQELDVVDEIRDLGIIHDSKLTYNKHIDYIAKKANKSIGFIKRQCSQFNNIKTAKILYCSHVRSILEYCSQIWNPQYDIYTNRLESIQRRFMKYLQFKCNKYDVTYELRCKRHHILPLQERRKIADIALLMKIAQNQIDSPYLLNKINLLVPTRSVRKPHNYLRASFSFTKYRRNSFIERSANFVNRLEGFPEFDLFNTSVGAFRTRVSRNWFSMITA